MLMYLFFGIFFVVFALGKNKEAFRESGDDWFVLAFNILVSVLIWPVFVLINIDTALEKEQKKYTRKSRDD